jgi:hypothetical protein
MRWHKNTCFKLLALWSEWLFILQLGGLVEGSAGWGMPGVFFARVQASQHPLCLFNLMVGVFAVNICNLPSLPSLF